MKTSYQEMKAYIISTGAPVEAMPYVEEGIYWFAKQHAPDVLPDCKFEPGPADLVVSSESIAGMVYEMLCTEFLRPSDTQMAALLSTTVLHKEDKDLYD